MAVGDKITASRFNLLQNRIAGILGFGAGESGYGQGLSGYGGSVSSVEVSNFEQSQNSTITADNTNSLYIDLLRARIHQIGVQNVEIAQIVDSLLSTAQDVLLKQDLNVVAENTSTFINDLGEQSTDPYGALKGISDFEELMDRIERDKFLMHPTQGEYDQGVTSTRSTAWNTKVSHEAKVSFRSADHRRHFFNSGGEIRIQASLDNPSGAKAQDWADLLATAGVVIFNYTSTSRLDAADPTVYASSVNPTETGIGNADITSTYQLVYRKTSNQLNTAGVYSANSFEVYAKELSDSEIQFKIDYNDDSTDPNIDNLVQGILNSRVGHFTASGGFTAPDETFLNVIVPPPLYQNISNL